MFIYFSPDINDNLSCFTGPFIAENANKILKNGPEGTRRNVVVTKSVKRLTHFYSYPEPAREVLVYKIALTFARFDKVMLN